MTISTRETDKARGPFTAHNWEQGWQLRRIHYAAEVDALETGRPFSNIGGPPGFNPVEIVRLAVS